jgi:hypothetical protein
MPVSRYHDSLKPCALIGTVFDLNSSLTMLIEINQMFR